MMLNRVVKHLLLYRSTSPATTRLLANSLSSDDSTSDKTSITPSDKTTSAQDRTSSNHQSFNKQDTASKVFANRVEISYNTDKGVLVKNEKIKSDHEITNRDIRLESDNKSYTPEEQSNTESQSIDDKEYELRKLKIRQKQTLASINMLTKLTSEISKAITPHESGDMPHLEKMLDDKDFFGVKNLFTVRELFDNRVHLGHFAGCWNKLNKKYLLGIRNNHHIIDIASTEQHLWRALNVISHTVYNGGFVLFVNNRKQFNFITRYTAEKCGEYCLTKEFWKEFEDITYHHRHMDRFDKLVQKYRPSLIICTSVNNKITQDVLLYANKNMIPTIGLVDSDVDPTHLTYVIPGNDDSNDSMVLYHRIFCNAISRAKRFRQEVLQTSSYKSKAASSGISLFAEQIGIKD